MISIIVPIYKVEKYLPKCIESLINQTKKDIEIILVDDGSPDGCPEICDEYAKKDSRIVVIHQPNRGVSAARNSGLNAAKGEFIGFVDPDDRIAPEMYEKMEKALNGSGAELAVCGYDYYFENGEIDEKRKYPERDDEPISQKELLNRFADMPPTVRHGVVNKLFRSDIIGSERFAEGMHSSEDVLFLTEYSLKVKNAVIVHRPYYENLVRTGSATHGGLSVESLADSFKAHDKMYNDSVSLYPDLKNHCLAFLLDVCLLKYGEAKEKCKLLPQEERKNAEKRIKTMKRYIKKNSFGALFDSEIYWKTRIYYLIF